jgi:hypothetical protein
MISAGACVLNREEGHPVELISIDPEPRTSLGNEFADAISREAVRVQDIPRDRFNSLGSNDILFIDSSHAVKRGSDVNYLILEVLPELNDGVIVHFHDIFLPWDYPIEWFNRGTYLSEQYLLQAYLSENPHYEVLLTMHALARYEGRKLSEFLPAYKPYSHGPSAFWIRRRTGPRTDSINASRS